MHIMIDLETMGTRPDAPIIAIGAVAFNDIHAGRGFYCNIDLKSAVDGGGVIEPSTVMWWMMQSEGARGALQANPMPLTEALIEFEEWLKVFEIYGVWGNGAAFDNVILSETYTRAGLKRPWPFWKDKCYRTIKDAYPDVTLERTGTHHNALDDARTQAEHLVAINKAHGGFL